MTHTELLLISCDVFCVQSVGASCMNSAMRHESRLSSNQWPQLHNNSLVWLVATATCLHVMTAGSISSAQDCRRLTCVLIRKAYWARRSEPKIWYPQTMFYPPPLRGEKTKAKTITLKIFPVANRRGMMF